MKWEIRVSSRAEKYYSKLSKDLKSRIKAELIALSEYEDPLTYRDVKPLIGELRGFYRLRVGGYRVIFRIIREDKIIAVVNIAPRGDIYKS